MTPPPPPYIAPAVVDLLIAGTRGQRVLKGLAQYVIRTRSWPSEAEMELLVAGAAFLCPDCGSISANLRDALQQYCGRCHRFPYDDVGFGT